MGNLKTFLTMIMTWGDKQFVAGDIVKVEYGSENPSESYLRTMGRIEVITDDQLIIDDSALFNAKVTVVRFDKLIDISLVPEHLETQRRVIDQRDMEVISK